MHLSYFRPKMLVPEVGVEPTRPEGQRILSPLRLPFRHPGNQAFPNAKFLEKLHNL